MLIKKDVSEIQEFFNIEDVLSPDEGKTHIVFQVLNAVVGDSRVIKVAKTAIDLGYRVTMLGMSRTRETIWTEIEGINVILIENPTYPLLKKVGMSLTCLREIIKSLLINMWNQVRIFCAS